MKQIKLLLLLASASVTGALAQSNGLTDMSQSRFAKMANTGIGAVHWTDGFWGDRFQVFSRTSLQSMWNTWNAPEISHGFRNFEIAAGVCKGEHWGPPFHDGDMYKWMEGVASVYAVNKDLELDKLMDNFITCVVKAQRADGYIHTPVVIEELNKGIDSHALEDQHKQTVIGTKVGDEDEKGAFANRLNFETYNLGHLMMAGIVHRRATGKTTLFDAAVKATDFLCHFYETASAELARNAICPSHYMGVVEMYRATGNPRYLELSKNLIDIRGMVENGTDDNQDRIPFRDQYRAMGHAVRANYLYAGVADVYAETGEQQLMKNSIFPLQIHYYLIKHPFLNICPSICRMSVLIQSPDITEPDTSLIPTFAMCSRQINFPSFLQSSVQTDNIMISDAVEPTFPVPTVNICGGKVLSGFCCRAMHYNRIYLSHDILFLSTNLINIPKEECASHTL